MPEKTVKQQVMSLSIKEKNALYAAYIPFIVNGGLFIPTNRDYEMGQEIQILLNLMDETERFHIHGKIIWKTPVGIDNFRTAGVGIQFNSDDSVKVRAKIENYLAGMVESDRPTYTM